MGSGCFKWPAFKNVSSGWFDDFFEVLGHTVDMVMTTLVQCLSILKNVCVRTTLIHTCAFVSSKCTGFVVADVSQRTSSITRFVNL